MDHKTINDQFYAYMDKVWGAGWRRQVGHFQLTEMKRVFFAGFLSGMASIVECARQGDVEATQKSFERYTKEMDGFVEAIGQGMA